MKTNSFNMKIFDNRHNSNIKSLSILLNIPMLWIWFLKTHLLLMGWNDSWWWISYLHCSYQWANNNIIQLTIRSLLIGDFVSMQLFLLKKIIKYSKIVAFFESTRRISVTINYIHSSTNVLSQNLLFSVLYSCADRFSFKMHMRSYGFCRCNLHASLFIVSCWYFDVY